MIELKQVSKYYKGNIKAVDNINLKINRHETLVLLGKSGCGKTTTLKMINRLIYHDSGTITIDNNDIAAMDQIELRRNIGYVIQDIGLFPHMTIKENISLAPKLKKWDKTKIDKETLNVLDIIKLQKSILKRYPHQLSGGQKQRIGVARALIANPDIILMDEPFGALDPITREELQEEFINLEKEIKKTIVFVTHDIFEAFKIGTRIALMDKGRIIQTGTPAKIANNPANDFVKRFVGKHLKSLLLELDDAV